MPRAGWHAGSTVAPARHRAWAWGRCRHVETADRDLRAGILDFRIVQLELPGQCGIGALQRGAVSRVVEGEEGFLRLGKIERQGFVRKARVRQRRGFAIVARDLDDAAEGVTDARPESRTLRARRGRCAGFARRQRQRGDLAAQAGQRIQRRLAQRWGGRGQCVALGGGTGAHRRISRILYLRQDFDGLRVGLQRPVRVMEQFIALRAKPQQHFGIVEQDCVVRRLLLPAQVGVGRLEVGEAAVQSLRGRTQIVQCRFQLADALVAGLRLLIASSEPVPQDRDGRGILFAGGLFGAGGALQTPCAPHRHAQCGHGHDNRDRGQTGSSCARFSRFRFRSGVFDRVAHGCNASRGHLRNRPLSPRIRDTFRVRTVSAAGASGRPCMS